MRTITAAATAHETREAKQTTNRSAPKAAPPEQPRPAVRHFSPPKTEGRRNSPPTPTLKLPLPHDPLRRLLPRHVRVPPLHPARIPGALVPPRPLRLDALHRAPRPGPVALARGRAGRRGNGPADRTARALAEADQAGVAFVAQARAADAVVLVLAHFVLGGGVAAVGPGGAAAAGAARRGRAAHRAALLGQVVAGVVEVARGRVLDRGGGEVGGREGGAVGAGGGDAFEAREAGDAVGAVGVDGVGGGRGGDGGGGVVVVVLGVVGGVALVAVFDGGGGEGREGGGARVGCAAWVGRSA